MPNSPDTAGKALVFSGEFRFLLDQKKRLTIPSKWRPEGRLEEVFIVKSLSRGCLVAMPLEVLDAMAQKAGPQASSLEAHQSFKDQFFANATLCPIDTQGRMVLPEDLCNFSGIVKEAVLTGSGEKFDIWRPEAWEKQRQTAASGYETLLKSIGL